MHAAAKVALVSICIFAVITISGCSTALEMHSYHEEIKKQKNIISRNDTTQLQKNNAKDIIKINELKAANLSNRHSPSNALFQVRTSQISVLEARVKARSQAAARQTIRNNVVNAQATSTNAATLQAPGSTLNRCEDPDDADCD